MEGPENNAELEKQMEQLNMEETEIPSGEEVHVVRLIELMKTVNK